MYIMSPEKCKELDRYAIEKLNFPSIILMENAATEVYARIKDIAGSYLIVCGTGNNGGDGLAVGRKLLIEGKDVHFVIVNPKEQYSEDFFTNYRMIKSLTNNITSIKRNDDLEKFKGLLNSYEVIVDSIFGVGINRKLDSFYCEIIKIINTLGKNIISIDVPSGLDCNTGKPLGETIRANITYSFEVIKRGFINYSAFDYLGRLEIVSIGIPEEIKSEINENILILEDHEYANRLIKRKAYGHKGDYGRATIFAGSLGFTGAAYISTSACVKTGAGLTTLVTSKESQKILSTSLIEAMTANFEEKDKMKELIKKANVISFGPGISKEESSEELLLYILDNSDATIVIDAEGINILAKRQDILEKIKGRAVLTPHPGEMSALIKKGINAIEDDRVNIVKEYSNKYGCVILLKGYNTVISDGESVYVNTTGSSKMASGGMGDCLTGVITSLIAQGHDKLDATLLGAYIHGKAGDYEGVDKYSVIATDIINNIPFVMNTLINN